ncbi:MAG: PaaI family thioesterase [Ilumatobacteraceae bacterium]
MPQDAPDRWPDLERRVRAGRAIRDLGHALVGHHAPPDLLDRVADAIEPLTAELDKGVARSRDAASFSQERLTEPGSLPLTGYDDRPVSGRSSPWGLDPELHRHGDEIEAIVVLREAHEGAPQRSHGGIVAALFDDVFGFVLGVIAQPAFTGELTIRYVAPTPLHRRLSCRVRLAERSGRKLLMTGELVDIDGPDERLLVTAKATFIAVDATAFDQATAERPAPPDEDA